MYKVFLDGITTTETGERVMSGKRETLSFESRDDAVRCFRYYHRWGTPYLPWVSFFDPRVSYATY
jgi:hypothetical protein